MWLGFEKHNRIAHLLSAVIGSYNLTDAHGKRCKLVTACANFPLFGSMWLLCILAA